MEGESPTGSGDAERRPGHRDGKKTNSSSNPVRRGKAGYIGVECVMICDR